MWSMERIMITPHVAGLSARDNQRLVAGNLARDVEGRPLLGVVDRQRGYQSVENGKRRLEDLSRRVGELLRAQGLVLAVAESCTGGGLADVLTDIPGSSDYFIGGVVAYSYEAKERLLGVPHDVLAAHGAVSPEVVTLMATGVRRALAAEVAVAISGIAGPGGGLPAKPVGLVYIALASAEGTRCRRYLWQGDRIANKRASVGAALELLIEYLEERH